MCIRDRPRTVVRWNPGNWQLSGKSQKSRRADGRYRRSFKPDPGKAPDQSCLLYTSKAGENAENGPVQVTTAAAEETEAVEAQAGAEDQTEAEPTGLYQPVTLLFAGDVYLDVYKRQVLYCQ